MPRRWVFPLAGLMVVSAWVGVVRAESPEGTSAVTEEEEEMDATVAQMDQEASTSEGAQRVSQRLAEEFSVEPSQIESLRDQQLGYGEIHHALSLAKQMPGGLTEENLNQVMTMRKEQQMGWGRIAQELGTKLGPATKRGGIEPMTESPTTEPPSADTGDTGGSMTATGDTNTQAQSLTRPGSSRGASSLGQKKGLLQGVGRGEQQGGGGVRRSGGSPGPAGGGIGGGGGAGARGKRSSAPGHSR